MRNPFVSLETRQKLVSLSEYLKLTALTTPEAAFDMSTYYSGSDICKTSACAVGHYALLLGWKASRLGVMPQEGFNKQTSHGVLLEDGMMPWTDFSSTMLGISSGGATETDWAWMFSGEWDDVDNTILGAAARIDHYLEDGVPEDFYLKDASGFFTETMVYKYLVRRTALEEQQAARLLVEPLSLDPRVAE